MILYVADEKAIYATQGLRMATKLNEARATYPTRFYLEVEYKGLTRRVRYSSESKRNAAFDALKAALPKCNDISTGGE